MRASYRECALVRQGKRERARTHRLPCCRCCCCCSCLVYRSFVQSLRSFSRSVTLSLSQFRLLATESVCRSVSLALSLSYSPAANMADTGCAPQASLGSVIPFSFVFMHVFSSFLLLPPVLLFVDAPFKGISVRVARPVCARVFVCAL